LTLREKFKQSIPGVVTANYVATALNIQPMSARNNVLPYLKSFGLINDEGKTQDLAKAWRDDKQYADVCRKMRERIYPQGLFDAISKPSEDRVAVERWFANETGAGRAAVKRMAAIYILISEADASKKPDRQVKRKEKPDKKTAVAKSGKEKKASLPSKIITPETFTLGRDPAAPGLNINLQIHISADATPDQIDKIFESMARHIYKR
jgi:hypothetical protein